MDNNFFLLFNLPYFFSFIYFHGAFTCSIEKHEKQSKGLHEIEFVCTSLKRSVLAICTTLDFN